MQPKCSNCNHELDQFGMSAQIPGAPVFRWCRVCGAMEWDGNGFMQTFIPQRTLPGWAKEAPRVAH